MNLLKRTATTFATAALLTGLAFTAAPSEASATPGSAPAAAPAAANSPKVPARIAPKKYTKKCSKYKNRKVRQACRKAKKQAQAPKKTAPAAASTQPTFAAPTSITYVSATCRRSGDVWDVTARWRVSGGRYTNLGDPTAEPTFNDHVHSGAARYINSHMEFHNWPGAGPDGEATSVEFFFQQMIAPIGRAQDPSTWRNVERWIRINLSCS